MRAYCTASQGDVVLVAATLIARTLIIMLQCKEWNERIRFIESTSSFYYTAQGKPPVPVKEAGKAQNIMAIACARLGAV